MVTRDCGKVFVTFTVLSVEGWPYEVISVLRSLPDENGIFAPDSSKFHRNFNEPFDCSFSALSPGRIVELGLHEKEHGPCIAHHTFALKDILSICHSRKGGFAVFTHDLTPSGRITFSAQAYPQRDRAVWRRGAQKLAKVHINAGHQFTIQLFTDLTKCSACNQVFWGFEQRGLQCQFCQMTIHQTCTNGSIPPCPKQQLPHEFGPVTFMKPIRCKHDRRLMWPCFSSGQRCINCGITVHRPCAEFVSQACPGRVTATSVGYASDAFSDYDDYDYEYERDYTNYQYPALLPDSVAVVKARKAPCWLRPVVPYDLGSFQIICLLGEGSFGKVFLARFTRNLEDENAAANNNSKPKFLALKAVRKDRIAINIEVTRIERKVLQISSRSPFLLHMLCTFQTNSHLFYAVDFVAGGAILFHIQYSKEGHFDVDRTRFYAAEVVCALEFLHERQIIYRDLKSDNVMLDLSGHIRLIDFGLSKDELGTDGMTRTICGTPSHTAPEIANHKPYSFPVDWWSFGAFVYEMLVGLVPFFTESGADIYSVLAKQYQDPSLPSYDEIDDKDAVEILKLLFEREPERRLGSATCPAGSVRQQAFFSPINWEILQTGQAEPPPLLPPRVERKFPVKIGDSEEAVDVSYFEGDFLNESVALSRIDDGLARTMVAHMFCNFSLTNAEYSSEKIAEQ